MRRMAAWVPVVATAGLLAGCGPTSTGAAPGAHTSGTSAGGPSVASASSAATASDPSSSTAPGSSAPTEAPVETSGATVDSATATGATPAGGPGWTPVDRTGAARLMVLPDQGRAEAQQIVAAVAVRGRGPQTGYARTAFGPAWTDDAGAALWSHDGCGTRDNVLARDLDSVVRRNRCVVTGGRFVDPYTAAGQTFVKGDADAWPVDHVVPLAYAWAMGASAWAPDKRVQFANDPLNLVVTTRSVNTAKSDSGPASWLPPAKAIRCGYVERFALVAQKYALPVTPADREVMTAQCR